MVTVDTTQKTVIFSYDHASLLDSATLSTSHICSITEGAVERMALSEDEDDLVEKLISQALSSLASCYLGSHIAVDGIEASINCDAVTGRLEKLDGLNREFLDKQILLGWANAYAIAGQINVLTPAIQGLGAEIAKCYTPLRKPLYTASVTPKTE